jgi:hypothetical protein
MILLDRRRQGNRLVLHCNIVTNGKAKMALD